MSYLVIARKYRPQTFSEVVGQEPVIQTLKSAIEQGKIAHAYLFTGPRGVGKTSMARILAKGLNCEKGPTSTPCQECTHCREITLGSSLDVLEIDGASNRGIDEVRSLRENVKFAPIRCRYKIYIIDEVHSLTVDAFNALLKTLEEPPQHVKFIFATTEPHRVLPTILSRCQRFDFRRIPLKLLVEKLSQIAHKEGITIDSESLHKIAITANGGLRDAQTILDQLAAYTQGEVKTKDVDEVLGIIDFRVIEEILDAIHRQDVIKPIELLKQMIEKGQDLSQLTAELLSYARNLLMSRMGIQNLESLLEVTPEVLVRVQEKGQQWSVEELLYVIHSWVRLQHDLKRTLSPRILMEVTLIRLAQTKNWIRMDEIVSRLEELEQNLTDQNPPSFEVEKPFNPLQQRDVPAAVESSGITLQKVEEVWSRVLIQLKSQKMSLASALECARPTRLEGQRLTISFSPSAQFHQELVAQANHRQLLEKVLSEVLGTPLGVEAGIDPGMVVQEKKQEEPTLSDPLVQSALNVFGGRVIRVEVPSETDKS